MRLLYVAGVALLMCGCSQEGEPVREQPPPSTGSVTVVDSTIADPPPVDPPQPAKNITIDGVELANPVVVTGRARTFENNVVLRVRDSRGGLIGETFTTSSGEMGQHNPFRGTLWLTRDPEGSVTVEALEYSAKDGEEQSLVTVQRPLAVETIEARLFFPDQNCTRVAAYSRRLPKSLSAARLLVEALVAGPTTAERGAGAAAPFPSGSRVESVILRGGILTVDFNERLQNVGGSCQSRMIRESVTQTLETLPAVKSVVITAGGSESLALQP